jgi:hypothetical protein
MTTANEIWGPERLKFINDNPKVVSLLYDLNLLPEVVLAHIRAAREEERKACLKIVNAVHPADGVEGCGCSHEIGKRIKRRRTKEGKQ